MSTLLLAQDTNHTLGSCGKMTAAVMGHEKIVLSKLVNNNNVKGRIAQFSKNEEGWRPPQTFAVGFWANREKSGSTLTLYEDIVSSDSDDDDEYTSKPLSRQPLYQSQQNFSSKVSAFDTRLSYKQIGSAYKVQNTTRAHAKLPEGKSMNKMQYCQEWLKPQHVPPIIGNVGTGNYNRLQSTSKWDARSKLSQSSHPRPNSAPHKTQLHSQKSNELVNLRRSATPNAEQLSDCIYENTRPTSQMSNSSTCSNSQSTTRRASRPTSVGSISSRPPTPTNESWGPPSSPTNVPKSPGRHRKSLQSATSNPTSASLILPSKHSVVRPLTAPVSSQSGGYLRLSAKGDTTRSAARDARKSETWMEMSASTTQLYPVQRSSSADSIQLERPNGQSATYKTEVQINMTSSSRVGMPPVPAPRKVKRAKSNVACSRPQSLYVSPSPVEQDTSRNRQPSGSREYKQKCTSFTGEDEVTTMSNQVESEVTDVNLFNVNEAAIIESKRIVSSSPFISETESRNVRNRQGSSQQEFHKKSYPPEIIPRNLCSSERSNLSRLDVGSCENNIDTDSSNVSSIYDNIHYNNNGEQDVFYKTSVDCDYENIPKSLLVPSKDTTSSWDNLSVTPIEFQTQCAQVCMSAANTVRC